jgi:hypothetical protein
MPHARRWLTRRSQRLRRESQPPRRGAVACGCARRGVFAEVGLTDADPTPLGNPHAAARARPHAYSGANVHGRTVRDVESGT